MAASILLLMLLLPPGDLKAAEEALAAGKAEEALALLGDLVRTESVSTGVLVVQGRALLRLRRYEAAVEPLLAAAAARPDDAALARDAAYACWGSAEGPFAQAYLDDALRFARRANDALLLADIQHARGDFESALATYRAASPPASERLRVLENIAGCYAGLGRPDEARTAYAEALEEAIARRDLVAAYRTGLAAGRGGRLLQWLDARVADEPENAWLLLYRGYARDALQQDENAAADLRRVAELLPDQRAARGRLAAVLARLGIRRQNEAALLESERVARELLDSDPGDAVAWQALYTLSWYAATNAKVERAYQILRVMIRIDPEDEPTSLNFCAMARRLGHHEEARQVFERLLESDPFSADCLVDFGILEDGLGNRAQAIALWRRALEVRPRDLNALENLFTTAWESGEEGLAREYATRALAIVRGPGGSPGQVARWTWFVDRLSWCPAAFRG